MSETRAEKVGSSPAPVVTVIARGGLWTIAGQVTGLAAALFATPFTLRLLGPARYGVWALLQSTIAWVGLADLGMSAASTRFAGEAHAHSDAESEACATWTAVWISTSVTAVVAAVVAFFAPQIVTSFLHVGLATRNSAVVALRIVAGGVLISAAMANLNTPLQVRLRYRTVAVVTQGSAVFQVVATPIALVTLGGGVATAAAVSTLSSAGALLAMFAFASTAQPAIRRPRFSAAVARRLVRFGGSLTLAGIADIPLTTADRILLGHVRSSVQVAYYTVASRLATLASAVPAAAAQPLFPAVIGLNARGDRAAATNLYRQLLQGAFLVLTPMLMVVALVARPFLAVWAGRAYAAHSTTACIVLLVGVWFQALSWLPLTYLMAIDRARDIARIRLAEIPPYLVLAALLAIHLGVLGAALAWSLRSAADSLIFFLCGTRWAKLSISPLTTRRAASLMMPVMLACAVAVLSEVAHALAVRALLALGLVVLYGTGAWLVMLVEPERAVMRQVLTRLLRLPRRPANAAQR